MSLLMILAATLGIGMLATAFNGDGGGVEPDTPADDSPEEDVTEGDIDPENDLLRLTDGPDSFAGTEADEEVDGGLGNDTLTGAGGADTLIGGADDDRIDGGDGDDRLFANDGDDTVVLSNGNDGVFLSGGDDYAAPTDRDSLNTGDDIVRGGDGNDTLIGDGGDDTLTGDAGHDVLDLTGAATGSAEGGLGDDHLLLDDGDQGFGGRGEDTFETWVTPGQDDAAVLIRDFDTARDELAVAIRNAPEGFAPEVTFAENGDALDAFVNGQRFATLNGLSVEDIAAIQVRLV